MKDLSEPSSRPQWSPRPHLGHLGLLLVAVFSLVPLLVESPPIDFLPAYRSLWANWGSKLFVLVVMLALMALRGWLDRRAEPWPWTLLVGLMGLAALFTAWHQYWVDLVPFKAAGQVEWYRDILNHRASVPHQYRPLPYGFTRSLEWITGDWLFACTAYRWFFTFWFLWASYRFGRLFLRPARVLAILLAISALYPLSIDWYSGQLTDPLSHSLFVLALIYVIEDRCLLLAWTLALGVLAKETVMLVVPAYWACYWRQGLPAFGKAVLLGSACLVAFLAVRVPLGWRLSYQNINGTTGLMIASNLGFPKRFIEYESGAPIYQNYLHPLLFVGAFLPFIAWRWRHIDGRLKTLCVTLTPLLLLSNLCFGWMYESRNYMPLVPLLATMAMPARSSKSRDSAVPSEPRP